jgi:hypothetical protein
MYRIASDGLTLRSRKETYFTKRNRPDRLKVVPALRFISIRELELSRSSLKIESERESSAYLKCPQPVNAGECAEIGPPHETPIRKDPSTWVLRNINPALSEYI